MFKRQNVSFTNFNLKKSQLTFFKTHFAGKNDYLVKSKPVRRQQHIPFAKDCSETKFLCPLIE